MSSSRVTGQSGMTRCAERMTGNGVKFIHDLDAFIRSQSG